MFRPHTLYIRIRIVRKVSEPAFAMKDQDVTDVIRRKQQTAMRYIGIDVSKATFVVAYSSDKGGEIRTFNNTTTGIKQFIGALPKDSSIHCVMEATGNYSAMLLYLLNVAGIAVSMENPLKIKNFARAMLSVTKTDEIDARLIALYGERMQPDPYKLRSDSILVLKQKRTVLRQLKKQLVATRNLKGSMEFFLLLTLNARKPSKRRLLSSRSKSRQWKRISLPWRKASTGNRWTCSPPSKASVLHWQPRLSWPQAGSPILIMPSN